MTTPEKDGNAMVADAIHAVIYGRMEELRRVVADLQTQLGESYSRGAFESERAARICAEHKSARLEIEVAALRATLKRRKKRTP
jgi:hypothetical protein